MNNAVSFRLNGQNVTVNRSDDAPLVYALRNDLGLKATRFGCGQESCGACIVSVDGQPTYSCTRPLSAVAGTDVLTAEGLCEDPVGIALLEAFRDEHAGQCGYCLSGILVSAHALLRACPTADRAAIIAALDVHLCRCGAHGSIIRAVERAVARIGAEV
ncbi:CoxS Aerobic-type carbon monoxide dehydrogenase, small subunit CoxS/CutS homologs [Paracoccaceae bacterium]